MPRVIFQRCGADNNKYYFDELTSASISSDMSPLEISAGWSMFPVAVLNGTSTFEMQFTTGRFDANLFAMTNAEDFKENNEYALSTSERYQISPEHTIELKWEPIKGTIQINGLEETDSETVEDGYYKVAGKVLTFNDNLEGYVEVIYDHILQGVQEVRITNRKAAVGSATAIWPVRNIRGLAA